MPLRFKDRRGHYGLVTESLEVEYTGRWKREVSDVVSEVKEDAPDDPMTHLIIELAENAPIPEVGRGDTIL